MFVVLKNTAPFKLVSSPLLKLGMRSEGAYHYHYEIYGNRCLLEWGQMVYSSYSSNV
jgi:hypothetical protein